MNINWRIIIPIVLLLIYALELADKLMKMNMEKQSWLQSACYCIYQHVAPMCLLAVTEIPDGHICSEDGLKSFGKMAFKAFLYGMAG